MQKQMLVPKKESASSKGSKSPSMARLLFAFACTLFLASLFAWIGQAPSSLLQKINPKEYKELTFIKPFTSLVGFNGKFCKESKSPNSKKASVLSFPHFNW